MGSWYQRDIVDSGRLPLLVCFAAFVLTYVVIRIITRLIRSGRGPFKNNVTAEGLHIHHAVPGIILLVMGAFMALMVDIDDPWSVVAALLIGVGTSLVLDEFALILHLEDVYWSEEGRISFEIVILAIACLGLLLVGVNPFQLDERVDPRTAVTVTVLTVVINLVFVVVCMMKGKYKMALLGAFIPFIGVIGGVRLARPRSRWARHRYSPAKLQRAVERAGAHDARWGPLTERIGDVVAGKPSEPCRLMQLPGSHLPRSP